MRRLLLTALAAGLAAACLLALGTRRGERAGAASPAPEEGRAPHARAAGREQVASGRGLEPGGGPGRRPPSLRGTRVDGGLTVDADGRFVPTVATRRLFDYFLTATGEEPPDAVRTRIVAAIERRLPPAAAGQATDLLDLYLVYRERARALGDGGVPIEDPGERLAAVAALRREVLGAAVADAFFADEERAARFAIEERRIATDATLTAEERGRRIEDLEATLPAALREARAAARAPARLARAESALRERGAAPEEIRALRERTVGAAAADRLAALDARRAEWQRRVDVYRADRAALERDAARTAESRAQALERLLAERFTPAERRRVEALDRIEQEAQAERASR